MVIRLRPTTATTELAAQLNAAGLTTGTGAPFDVKAVQLIRHAYPVPVPNPYTYDWIKTAELATGCASPWSDQIEAQYRCRIIESGHLQPAARRSPPRKHFERPDRVAADRRPGRPHAGADPPAGFALCALSQLRLGSVPILLICPTYVRK
jgi:hypothetical protein